MTKKKIYVLLAVLLLILLACSLVPCDKGEVTEESTADIEVVAPTSPDYGVVGIDAAELIVGTDCDYALLTRVNGLEVLATRNSSKQMYPASMTKIMTFIVAYENADSLEAQTEITKEIKNKYPDASRVGIDVGDLLTTEQLLYALLLESDTDAAIALALYTAGGEEEFVALMNEKCAEIGLENTHFMNVTGLHHKEHYTTVSEMTSIFAYALEIPLFREIITTENYSTRLDYYDDGVLKDYRFTFKNTTISRDKGRFAKNGVSLKFSNGEIIGGKTGFTDEAKYCLALLVVDDDGEEYIVITANAATQKDSARDSLHICKNYIK